VNTVLRLHLLSGRIELRHSFHLQHPEVVTLSSQHLFRASENSSVVPNWFNSLKGLSMVEIEIHDTCFLILCAQSLNKQRQIGLLLKTYGGVVWWSWCQPVCLEPVPFSCFPFNLNVPVLIVSIF